MSGTEPCTNGTSPPLRLNGGSTHHICMPISDDDVAAFIDVYEHEYGMRLRADEAREMAARLIELYEAVSRPLPKGNQQGASSER